MRRLFNMIMFFICICAASVMTTLIFSYYLKEETTIKIINPELGGYEFTLWLIYIPILIATYYTSKLLHGK